MRAPRLLSVLLLAALTAGTAARADELPVQLQIQLLSKMTSSIPNLQPASGPLKVLVVFPGKADATSRAAQTVVNAIRQTAKFGSFDTEAKPAPFIDAAALKALIIAEKPQALYVPPEVDPAAVAAIVEASSGTGVVTISATSDQPKQGIMLGFALMEARPRVLVNLKVARREQVEFKNALLTYTVIVDK